MLNSESKIRKLSRPLSKEMEISSWTVPPLIRDSFTLVIGSAVSSITMMPIVQRHVKGPIWLQIFIGAPHVVMFSSGFAGLAGGAVPALTQLASSSYHAAVSSSSSTPNEKM